MSREVHGMVRGLNEVLRDRRMYTFVSKLEIMYIPMGQSLDPLCIIAGVPPLLVCVCVQECCAPTCMTFTYITYTVQWRY